MNFLSLCQDLRSESGIQGTGPASVTDQIGFNLQLVNWINKSYRDVQNLHSMWLFMTEDFSFNTIAAQANYLNGTGIGTTGLSNLKNWKIIEYGDIRCYLTSLGTSNEQYLTYIPWNYFRQTYLFGSRRNQSGRPRFFSIKPDKALIFYPIPNDIYTIIGEYFKQTESMVNNIDEPNFPADFHEILVWKGLMYYGAFDAANERYTQGKNEYGKLRRALEFDQLPDIQFGAPLA